MKKIISSILISTILIQAYGCYSEQLIDKGNLYSYRDNKIQIVTSERKVYSSESKFWNTMNDTLFITRKDSIKNETIQKIPFSSIKLIYADQFDLPETILAGMGISFVALIITGLIIALQKPWGPFGD